MNLEATTDSRYDREREMCRRLNEGSHCNECHPELHRAQCLKGGCVAEAFIPCSEAGFGVVTNCKTMNCEGSGCAIAAARATPPGSVSLDDLR